MKHPLAISAIALVTLQAPSAEGQDGLLGQIAAAPFAAADGALHTAAGAAGEAVDFAGQAAEEAVYVTGDAVEFVYRVHPAPRVGRFVGLLPEGKMGLLPSHHEPVFPLNKVQRLLTGDESSRAVPEESSSDVRRGTKLVLRARIRSSVRVAARSERPVTGTGEVYVLVRASADPRHTFESGWKAFRRKDYRAASLALESVVTRDPDHAAARYLLALSQRRRGLSGDAERWLESAVACERSDGSATLPHFFQRIQGSQRTWIEAARREARVGPYSF